MDSSSLLSIVTFVYGFAALLYIISWIFNKELPGKTATWVTIAGVAGNTAGIIIRWFESYQVGYGHAPFSNMYESLIFFAWTIAVVYLVLEFQYKNRVLGAFVVTLVFFTIAYASLSPNISSRIQPLIPALKSNWLIAHVITCFLGYAGFAIAFGMSILYLIKKDGGPGESRMLSLVPEQEALDEMIHQMVMFGFFFLSIGIITGAVWANSAWGRYWGWDPKETWSLVTWFIYAMLLHARLVRGWHGKRIAIISIIGFMAVIFTYFGVNYLPGLHSYG